MVKDNYVDAVVRGGERVSLDSCLISQVNNRDSLVTGRRLDRKKRFESPSTRPYTREHRTAKHPSRASV